MHHEEGGTPLSDGLGTGLGDSLGDAAEEKEWWVGRPPATGNVRVTNGLVDQGWPRVTVTDIAHAQLI